MFYLTISKYKKAEALLLISKFVTSALTHTFTKQLFLTMWIKCAVRGKIAVDIINKKKTDMAQWKLTKVCWEALQWKNFATANK